MSKVKLFTFIIINFILLQSQTNNNQNDILLNELHRISSHKIIEYIKILTSDKYESRLTGTQSYEEVGKWCIDLFTNWGIKPAVNGKFHQYFPHSYTLIKDKGELAIYLPTSKDSYIKKNYLHEEDYYVGGTSDSGTVKAEVVYVGYGISAPEFGYDEYAGIDVKGKIVAFRPEVPNFVFKDDEVFKQWRKYQFHQYKTENAVKKGAIGIIQNYLIVNPNNVFKKGIIRADVGDAVFNDLFSGIGNSEKELLQKLNDSQKPVSFNTGKIVSIKANTEHFPNAKGFNLIGKIEGSDSKLKNDVILLGAHLDGIGMNGMMFPGADDNCSAVAVLLSIAEALKNTKISFKRTIAFVLFGAEEQGVAGSEYLINNPVFPNSNIKAFINLESVGKGEGISIDAGDNYPSIANHIKTKNDYLIKRPIRSNYWKNLARPRNDVAHFLWAKIPSVSMGTFGNKGVNTYHRSTDRVENLNPEIMEDLAKILFLSIIEMANE